MSHRFDVRQWITRLCAASISVVLGIALSACVGGSPSAPNATGPAPGSQAHLTVVSQFGDNPALQQVLNKLNERYHQQHPEVTVEIRYLTLDDLTRTLPLTLSSGSGPDIIDYDAAQSALGDLAKNGLVVPLTRFASHYGWQDKLTESAVNRTTYDSEIFGIPRSTEAVGIYYNADLFSRLGIEPPKTYAGFLTAADKLKAAGVTPIAFGNKDQWPSSHLVGAAIHSIIPLETISSIETLDGDGSWTNPAVPPAFEEAVNWARKGYLSGDFNGVSFDDAVKTFYAGKAGMLIEGTGVTPDIIENMGGVNVTFASFPMKSPSAPQQAEGGVGGAWAITATSKAPAIAADWLNFVHFSNEAEQAWFKAGVLPTTHYTGSGVDVAPLVQDGLAVTSAADTGGGCHHQHLLRLV